MKTLSYFQVGIGFPFRLESVMAQKRLSYLKVSKDTGISRETLRHWRNGYRYPNRLLAYRFCQQYSIDMSWLLIHEGEPILKLGSRVHARLKAIKQALHGLKGDMVRLNAAELNELGSILLAGRREVRKERIRRENKKREKITSYAHGSIYTGFRPGSKPDLDDSEQE